MGCNRLKSPNSGSSEFHESIYGDVHGSRWMDVFHLTGKHQKGEEKRGFRNRHQDGIIFFTRNAGFGLSGKNLIESTTHVWKLNINKMGVALVCIFFLWNKFSLRTAIVLQLVSSTCQGFPVFTIYLVYLHLQKKRNRLDLAALPRKSVANYETIFNF